MTFFFVKNNGIGQTLREPHEPRTFLSRPLSDPRGFETIRAIPQFERRSGSVYSA